MRNRLYALLTAAAVAFCGLLPAAAQNNLFPQTLAPNTVVGRTGISPGPAQAIPFSLLSGFLLSFVSGDVTCNFTSVCKVNTAPAGVSSAQFGLWTFGDSITLGTGASSAAVGYAQLMANDFALNSGTWTNFAVSGSAAADANSLIFTDLNPSENTNPLVTLMIGTNDVAHLVAGYLNTFSNLQYASAARAALSNISTIAGSAGTVTKTGSWANDTTFANLTGTKSSTNGSTASASVVATNGLIYIYYGSFAASGGTFTVQIDGVAATDTITGSATLTSQPAVAYFTSTAVTEAVALARYPVSAGTHTVRITVTSATNAANPVTIFGFALPPRFVNRGITGPKIFISGIPYQNNDANSAGTASVNAATQAVAAALAADGLNVHFVDVRHYTNSTLDMTDVATQNCLGSTLVGVHPNDCGHQHLANAFEEVINPIGSAVDPLNNVRLGNSALLDNTTGNFNTSLGYATMLFNTTGSGNAATGASALHANTTGTNNTADGSGALAANTTGSSNVGIGVNALAANTTGGSNIGIGLNALLSSTTATGNIGIGNAALNLNTSGINNTAVGTIALQFNTTGTDNTAVGATALNKNTGSNNTGVGSNTLALNTTGADNVAIGSGALAVNTTGGNNNAIGYLALSHNTTGANNVANGQGALFSNVVGSTNTAIGFQALFAAIGSDNSATGANALAGVTSGAQNAAFGSSAAPAITTGNQNTSVGYQSLLVSTADTQNTAFGFRALADLNGGGNNIAVGPSAGRGIVTGSNNVVIGGVTGLAAGLAGAIVLGDGAGNIRYDYGKTTAATHTFAGGLVSIPTSTPASSSAACAAGVVTWDASFIYVCIAVNTWKRVAIATW